MSSTTFLVPSLRNNCCSKLWLLIGKNASVHMAHPFRTAIIIWAPIILFLYSQVDQLLHFKEPVVVPDTKYPQLDLASVNVTSVFYSPTNYVLGEIVRNVANNLGTKHVESYLYASELEVALKEKDAFVGIEFEDHLRTIIDLPAKVKAALRFPLHLRSKKHSKWPVKLFRLLADDIRQSYYETEGFLEVQARLSEALIRARNLSSHIHPVKIQPFPNQAHTDNFYLLRSFKTLLMVFPFIFLGPSLIIGMKIVAEKQNQMRHLMKVMGLTLGLNWLSWLIVTYIMFAIPALIIVILMKWSTCPNGSIWVLLFIFNIYLLTLISFTFMITAFVSSTVLAIIATCLMHVVSFLPYLLSGQNPTITRTVLICLFMNSAMPFLLTQVVGYEIRGIGAQWRNIYKTCHPEDKLSIVSIILLMMVTNVLRMLCCFYVEQMNMGEFGVSKKWYFPFKRDFWCPWNRPRHVTGLQDGGRLTTIRENIRAFQDVHHNMPPVMEVQNLRKVIGENMAVSDFSLKFYEDEITVLLGHNGAGKTTIFRMIAGLYSPTSGRVFIHGFDMGLSAQMARKSLSICPQHNILFEELSPFWHIVFFSRLKGYTHSEAKLEAVSYLQKMNLIEQANIKVKNLTLGMQRKLSLCCALCANTKVVLLDEPSTSLDASSRRDVWNLLRMERTGRCILLNTHNMEAAQVLGDRIAIICDGKLYGYGSSEYIISNLGPGYRLVCVQLDNCNVNDVTMFLNRYIKNIQLESVVGADISYRLPKQQTHKFHKLFIALEGKLVNLKLSSFGVSAPTLGETFLNIGADKMGHRLEMEPLSASNAWVVRPNDSEEPNPRKRCINDWNGLLIKKILYTRHYLYLFSFLILLPLLIFLLVKGMNVMSERPNPITIAPYDLHLYPGAVVIRRLLQPTVSDPENPNTDIIFNDNSARYASEYDRSTMLAGATLYTINHDNIEDYLLEHINLEEEGFKTTYVAAATFSASSATAWFNQRLEHAATLSLVLIYKAMGRVLADLSIEVVNKPRPDSDPSVFDIENTVHAVYRATFVSMYLCFAVAAFVLMPIQERVFQMKQQQLISGISIWSYWLSHLLWDFLIFVLMAFSVILALSNQPAEVLKWLLILLLVFGFSALTFTYLLSFFFKEPGIGMAYMLVISCTIVYVATVVTPHLTENGYKIVHSIFLILPHYAIYCGSLVALKQGSELGTCESLHLGSVCELNEVCCHPTPINVWSQLSYLLVSGIIYFALLLLMSKLPTLSYAIKRRPNVCLIENEDRDVSNARRKVDEILKNEDQLKAHSLVCDGATKKYYRHVAVNCLSLNIMPYECFGLLGQEAAGKSCAMKMIVGNHIISEGEIYVKGFSMKTHMQRCYKHLGYCPQKNTILNFMTGREMLRFACLTSGIKKQYINDIIDKLAESFVLTKHLDQHTKHYSTGTKRKLNIAMAMLAETLVCLDEPTSGVDMSAKHEIWLVLQHMRQLGMSFLVTTNSVDECKALCTSMSVMINGQLRCMGTWQYIMSRFNKGIKIKIQVASLSELATLKDMTSDYEEESSGPSPRPSHSRGYSSIVSRTTLNDDSITEKGTQTNIKKRKTKLSTSSPRPSSSKKSTGSPITSNTPERPLAKTSITSTMSRGTESLLSRPRASTRVTTTSHLSSEISFLSDGYTRSGVDNYYLLIRNVERKFKKDFPSSYVKEKYIYRGFMTIGIPDKDLKWSTIFRYMEENRNELQIINYTIGQTSLEDILVDFAKSPNSS